MILAALGVVGTISMVGSPASAHGSVDHGKPHSCIYNKALNKTIFLKYEDGSLGSVQPGRHKCGVESIYNEGTGIILEWAKKDGLEYTRIHTNFTCGTTPYHKAAGHDFYVDLECSRGIPGNHQYWE